MYYSYNQKKVLYNKNCVAYACHYERCHPSSLRSLLIDPLLVTLKGLLGVLMFLMLWAFS